MTARRDALALSAASLALSAGLSRLVGPSFAEVSRLRASDGVAEVVRAVARGAPAALWSPSGHAAYAAFEGHGTLPVLLSAWSRLSLGRVGVVDLLTSARLPWLVLAAMAPALVYLAARPSLGRAPALLAGALLLALPRWVHAAACASDAAVATSLWWLVIVGYLACLDAPRPRRRARVVGLALALGLGATVTMAVLWVLPLVLCHYWLARSPTSRRLLRRGRLPVPMPIAVAVALLPVIVFATNPALWGQNAIGIVRWALAPLEPAVTPSVYAARVVKQAAVPASYSLAWLGLTLPAAVVACAATGLAALAHRALARRFASGSPRPPADRRRIGALVALGLVATLLAPACEPRPLVVFPPRLELALPFVAIAAAVGLERGARVIAGARRWGLVAAVVVAAVLWLAVRAPRTGAASFDELLGGARTVVAARVLSAGDGSEIAALAPAIDALGRPHVTLSAPDVPPELWAVLHDAGRLRTSITSGRTGELALVRGPAEGGTFVGSVKRDGVVLWTLVAR